VRVGHGAQPGVGDRTLDGCGHQRQLLDLGGLDERAAEPLLESLDHLGGQQARHA